MQEAHRPGPAASPLDGDLDLLTATNRAGRFTQLAQKKKVTVSRGGNTTLLDLRDGNEQVARIVKLRAGDIVNVEERLS